MNEKNYGFLSGNVLKIIALVCMTIDHIGLILFPDYIIFRIIGRIAFPIFAYFIAEGCRYTRNKLRYFLLIFGLGIAFDIVSRIFAHTTDCNILVTFGLAILLVYLFDWLKKSINKKSAKLIFASIVSFVAAAAAMFVVCSILPNYISWFTGVDYGFFGIMVVVLVSIFDRQYLKLICLLIGLVILCLVGLPIGPTQWFSLVAVLFLSWYNGERGKLRLKYLFYIYYPAHILLIYGISMLI